MKNKKILKKLAKKVIKGCNDKACEDKTCPFIKYAKCKDGSIYPICIWSDYLHGTTPTEIYEAFKKSLRGGKK